MKVKTILMYIFFFSWLSACAQPMMGIYGGIDKIVLKFLAMGVVVPLIAIYMLHKDKNVPNPSRFDIAVTFLLSVILIWLSYEVSTETFIPTWGGLILGFILGLFSLSIVMKIKEKITGKDGIIDALGKSIKQWISKQLGDGK